MEFTWFGSFWLQEDKSVATISSTLEIDTILLGVLEGFKQRELISRLTELIHIWLGCSFVSLFVCMFLNFRGLYFITKESHAWSVFTAGRSNAVALSHALTQICCLPRSSLLHSTLTLPCFDCHGP